MATESDSPMAVQTADVDSHSEERAAKRIKIDDAATSQDQNGETGQDTARPSQAGNGAEPTPEASKPSEENAEPTDRVKGMAPIKKE